MEVASTARRSLIPRPRLNSIQRHRIHRSQRLRALPRKRTTQIRNRPVPGSSIFPSGSTTTRI
jgi:hypothetical protein